MVPTYKGVRKDGWYDTSLCSLLWVAQDPLSLFANKQTAFLGKTPIRPGDQVGAKETKGTIHAMVPMFDVGRTKDLVFVLLGAVF
jgi:hypothetical protein